MSEQAPEGATPEVENDEGQQDSQPDTSKLQSALEKEREARRSAEKRARDGDAARVRLEKLEEASKSELQRAVDAARQEGAQSAMQAANARLVRSEARALAAAAKFRDPSDAVAFLGDLDGVTVTESGDVDAKALSAALTDLAKQKPYLLAEDRPTRPQGDAGQGPRADGAPTNMNDFVRGLARKG